MRKFLTLNFLVGFLILFAGTTSLFTHEGIYNPNNYIFLAIGIIVTTLNIYSPIKIKKEDEESFFDLDDALEQGTNKAIENYYNNEGKEIIEEKIKTTFSNDFQTKTVQSIRSNYSLPGSASEKHQVSDSDIYYSSERLRELFDEKIEFLTQNRNANLIIGLLISIIALFLLGILIFTATPNPNNSILFNLLNIQFPKVLFAVFAEILAFFFFRQYRSLLQEIKYYQNEKTNLHSIILSLQIARQSNNKDLLEQVAIKLLNTERNFPLHKDESTVAIQTAKIKEDNESQLRKFISENIEAVLKSREKEKPN